MTNTLVQLTGNTSLVLCPEHRADAMMWLWQEFDGAWSATVTGHRACDACRHGDTVPAAFRAALSRQLVPAPASKPGRPLSDFRNSPRTLSSLS